MAHRIFRDARGNVWEAWEVHPSSFERRLIADRRAVPRTTMDRRQRIEHRVRPKPGLSQGWLVFANREEKRRLAPIPSGWDERSDAEMASLLESATPSGKPRRLIE